MSSLINITISSGRIRNVPWWPSAKYYGTMLIIFVRFYLRFPLFVSKVCIAAVIYVYCTYVFVENKNLKPEMLVYICYENEAQVKLICKMNHPHITLYAIKFRIFWMNENAFNPI